MLARERSRRRLRPTSRPATASRLGLSPLHFTRGDIRGDCRLEPSPVADRARSLVGGALLGSRVREAMPGVPITESHPKALLLALGLDDSGFAARFGIRAMSDDLHPLR